jgi:hypothetical protein
MQFRLTVLITCSLVTLTASVLTASEIDLTAGPYTSSSFGLDSGQEIQASISEDLLVTSTTLVTLSWKWPNYDAPPGPSNCDVSNGGYCLGVLHDIATVNDSIYAEAEYSGQYGYGQYQNNNTGPTCGLSGIWPCTFSLNPGFYTFSTVVSDQLVGLEGATVLPFTEGFTGVLTYTSGDIQVATPTPEPSTASLLVVPGIAGLLIGLGRRRSVHCLKRRASRTHSVNG